jgi:Periplasmic copper-binding protein (NosD)
MNLTDARKPSYKYIPTTIMSMWRKHTSDLFIASLLAFSALTTIITSQPLTILAQTSDLCGSTISSDVELTADITCEGDGIRVGGDNLTVNLNGFTLRGSGVESDTTGIIVDGASGVIINGPGMVTGFGTGVAYTAASGGAMKDVFVGTNDIGVLLDSTTGTHIRHDYIADNRIGVFSRVSDNMVVEEVQMSSNDEGIRLERSTGIDIDFNIIMDGLTAIYLDDESIDNAIFYNIMFRNEVSDMNFAGGEGSVAGNLHGYNECTQGVPSGVCLGRALPSGEILTGSKEHGESIERAVQLQPEDLSPEEEQAAKALREMIIAGGSQNQTST